MGHTSATTLERLIQDVKLTPVELCPSWKLEGKHIHTSGNAYRIVVFYENHEHTFLFFDNAKNASTKTEILGCWVSDAMAYEDCMDMDEFIDSFGYKQASEGINAYKACERQWLALQKMFNFDEIQLLKQMNS